MIKKYFLYFSSFLFREYMQYFFLFATWQQNKHFWEKKKFINKFLIVLAKS